MKIVQILQKSKELKLKFFHAYLTYTPSSCPKCKCINNGTDGILNYTYNLYQGIIKSINNCDKNKFLNIIHNVANKKIK